MEQYVWTGKDLIDRGVMPGRHIGNILKELRQIAVVTDVVLQEVIQRNMPVEPVYMPLQDSVKIDVFLSQGDEYETANYNAVMDTMTELVKTPTVVSASVMPDACPAGSIGTIPVGGMVVARNAIHPGMHSADVCCSMSATNFGDVDPLDVLNVAHELSHFGPGGHSIPVEQIDLDLLDRILVNRFTRDQKTVNASMSHLRTSGDGNHFISVGRSETTGDVWLISHFGSRGFGAGIYKKGMEVAEKFRVQMSPKTLKQNAWIPLDTDEGAEYWDALEIAHDWTRANHNSLHDAVLSRLSVSGADRIFTPHNFVFRDPSDDQLVYHAKGSTPVNTSLLRDPYDIQIVPMNMAQPILFVKAHKDNEVGFAPHGAGRIFSRSQFARQQTLSEAELVAQETRGIDARFWSGIPDISELPSAYKNAATVQADMKHFGLAETVDRIMPYGNIMAGNFEKSWKKM